MIVKGKARWASVNSPNTTFEPVWCIDVVVDQKKAKELKAQGLRIKKNDDGELLFKVKRKVMKSDGSLNMKPDVVDANKDPFSGNIGNDSIVNVQYSVYDWKNSFGTGRGVDLVGVQILELIPYTGNSEDEFEKEEGYRAVVPEEYTKPVESSDSVEDDDFDDDIPF